MKKVLSILYLFSFVSCSSVKQLANEKVNPKIDCQTVVLNNKSPLVDVNIDGFDTHFLFDTGATRSVLIDSTAVPNFSSKKMSSFGSLKGADNKKIEKRLLTVHMNSSLFESNTKVLSFVTMPASQCQQVTSSYSGILGLDVFFENKLGLQLDFTNKKICNIGDRELQQCLQDHSYELVKSECQWSQVYIYLTIEDKEYKFLLDTGYTGSIILPFDEKRRFRNDTKIELEGSLFQTISSHTSGQELVYEKMPIAFAGKHFESKVNVSTSIKSQNVGIDFIKAFDWLIDFNHNKVYVKRNQNVIANNFSRKIAYYAKVYQDKLEIVIKEKTQTQYNLGDEIVSVNGQKVTHENQCELQDLLNKTEDWNSLQLEVISNSK